MSPHPAILLALAAAAVLYALSRTKQGGAVVDSAVGGTLDFVDVTAERIKSAVLSRGYRNHNPGNIRYIEKNPWNGQTGNDGGYGIYSSPEAGTRALGKQLEVYARRGLVTVRDIIATWAPSSENNTQAYINAVSKALGVGADAPLDVQAVLPKLARAIAQHENGYLDSGYNWEWVYLP